jgi:hypothetical protein
LLNKFLIETEFENNKNTRAVQVDKKWTKNIWRCQSFHLFDEKSCCVLINETICFYFNGKLSFYSRKIKNDY